MAVDFDPGWQRIYRRVAGIDVHRMMHRVTVLIEHDDGRVEHITRKFGGFRHDCRALAQWLAEFELDVVIMESTGIDWKSVYAHCENAGLNAWVVNAHRVKNVPGRKTDVADSQWLALLARCGMVKPSFIPPRDLRELRVISRYRRKLSTMLASELNRLHKTLDDAGIKLGGVVSDINGVSAREMVAALIEGQPLPQVLGLARGRLKQKLEDLSASLQGDLSARHVFVLTQQRSHIDYLERQISLIDDTLMQAMLPYRQAHELLQTIPGIDRIAAAMILIEIGDDMQRFGKAERLAHWAALSPGNNESAGKRRSARIGHGNSVIRHILCECANAARMTKSSLASKYRSLMVRKPHKKAIVAVAHKMLRLIFLILSRLEPYLDRLIDYEAMSAKKNAPRWIKQLKNIGRWPTKPGGLAAA